MSQIWAETFLNLAKEENPGNEELALFLSGVIQFLEYVLDEDELNFLWKEDPSLRELAKKNFNEDIIENYYALKEAILSGETPIEAVKNHGLSGQSLHFKFRALDVVSREYEGIEGYYKNRNGYKQILIKERLKKMFKALDSILDSVIDANGGMGGAIKEFKDIISSLISSFPKDPSRLPFPFW